MVLFNVVLLAPESTGTGVAISVTVTSWDSDPGFSVMFETVRLSCSESVIPVSLYVEKLLDDTVKSYVPGSSAGKLKNPDPFDFAVLFEPVASFVSVTCAPTTTAPVASVTVPLNEPVMV